MNPEAISKLEGKIIRLRNILEEMGSVVIAYSGGVDSSLLLKMAVALLGKKVLAVTARSQIIPGHEIKDAKRFARSLKCKHKIINYDCFSSNEFKSNPRSRCYICKKKLFTVFLYLKNSYKYNYLIEGTNHDDKNSLRPGLKALKELDIRSPLAEACLTKKDIRAYSKILGLPTWDRPALACLATRIPYGEEITEAKLKIIEEAESFIASLGIKEIRVRYHYPIARIEVPDGKLQDIIKNGIREKIIEKLKRIGFEYITADLENYGPGSMDETEK